MLFQKIIGFIGNAGATISGDTCLGQAHLSRCKWQPRPCPRASLGCHWQGCSDELEMHEMVPVMKDVGGALGRNGSMRSLGVQKLWRGCGCDPADALEVSE